MRVEGWARARSYRDLQATVRSLDGSPRPMGATEGGFSGKGAGVGGEGREARV